MQYYNEKEIQTTLKLYTIAKIKANELIHLKTTKSQLKDSDINSHLSYYEHIITVVDKWLKEMTIDEKELIKLRFFDNLTLDAISIKLGYSNHTAVIKKCNEIIKKIKERGY